MMGSLELEEVLQTESNHFRDDGAEVHRCTCVAHGHTSGWSLVIPTLPRVLLCLITSKAAYDLDPGVQNQIL